jgi:hypothetical protein
MYKTLLLRLVAEDVQMLDHQVIVDMAATYSLAV